MFGGSDLWTAIPVIVGSYLLGSVSLSFVAGKKASGKDLTRVGSGSAGAANVWQQGSRSMAVGAFAGDIAKGIIPVVVARMLGLGLPVELAAGLASVAGHNWSVFLGFRGGRGIATTIGLLLMVAPKELALAVLIAAVGLPLRQLALFALFGLVSLPVMGWWWGQAQVLIAGQVAILLLAIAKRLEANRAWRVSPGKRWLVLRYRLIFDRDVRDRKAWINRDAPSPMP